MRAALLAAVVTGAALVPGPAAAAGCFATADAPTAQHAFGASATGAFYCVTPRAWLAVDVCLEVLDVVKWRAISCGSATETDTTDVSASAYGCRYGVTLIRSTASGRASTGETASAVSVPVVYYCTPL